MRSLFKLSLAALVAMSFAAGMALAQDKPELKVGLTIRDAFGNLSKSDTVNQKTDPAGEKDKSTTAEAGWKNEGQADLQVTFSTPTVTGRAFYRFREDLTPVAAVAPNTAGVPFTSLRSDIYWKATDAFTLGFMARSLGSIPGTTVAYTTYGGTVTGGAGMEAGGTVGPVGFFSDATGIDARFGAGPMTVGLLVLDSCVPACGYKATPLATFKAGTITGIGGATASSTTIPALDFTGTKADQSYVVYYSGAFGALNLGAFLSNASAKIASSELTGGGLSLGDGSDGEKKDDDANSAAASLLDVNLSYALGGGLALAFEYWSQSQTCVTKLADKCSAKATTGMVLGVAAPAGPGVLKAHFVSVGDTATLAEDFTQTTAVTDMLVEFAIPMTPQFKLVPLFATRTTVVNDTAKDFYKADKTTTATFVALGARGDF